MNDNELKLMIDPSRPGVAMIEGGDKFAGMLLGVHARRIVACVNACQGLSTAAMETSGEQPVLALVKAAINTNVYCREMHAGTGPLFDAVRALEEDPAT